MNPNSEDENTGRCILQANFCAAQIVERRETLRVIAEDPDESRVHEFGLGGPGRCDRQLGPVREETRQLAGHVDFHREGIQGVDRSHAGGMKQSNND